jgi:hypothetical protein
LVYRKCNSKSFAKILNYDEISGRWAMMKKYLWSTIDASSKLIPYYIVEVSEAIAKELEFWRERKGHWKFIADKLENRGFSSYFDEYGRKRLFWYNNVLEDYEEALERLTEEYVKCLRDYYDEGQEEYLWEEAEERAKETLEELPVIRIE